MVRVHTKSKQLAALRETIAAVYDIVLSDVAMLSEIPAPTYGERIRATFLSERFSESQLDDCATDDIGNAFGILAGRQKKRNILVAAHLDTNFPEETDHTVRFERDCIRGVGVSDNSIGAAVIASLPTILERLEIHLDANIILMGSVHSLGSGNIAGMRSFLNNTTLQIDNAICIEGNTLGRLSVSSQSMFRGEIRYRTAVQSGGTRGDTNNAVMWLNLIINRILELRLPSKPLTNVVINAIRCGRSFNAIPVDGTVRFEINSETENLVDELANIIQNICDEVSARSEAEIVLDTIATRRTGGLPFSHPLVETARSILLGLEVEPRFQYSTSELSACIDRSIPALTIGLTTSINTNTTNERVDIAPIPTGIAQLVQLLVEIDSGKCDVAE